MKKLVFLLVLALICLLAMPISSSGRELYFGISANSRSGSTLEKIEKIQNRAVPTGVKWLREDLEWERVEPTKGNWDWSHYDALFQAAAERGMTILPILNSPPCWAVPGGGSEEESCWNSWPKSNSDFAYFTARAVERYGPGGDFWEAHPLLDDDLAARHWEVWNEPYYPEFTNDEVDPARYAPLYKAAVISGREANPETRYLIESVVDARVKPEVNPKEWVPWAETLVEVEPTIGNYIDGIAIHPYPENHDPDYEPEVGTDASFRNTERNYQRWRKLGINKPIWITEVGYSACENDAENENCVPGETVVDREEQKAEWLAEIFDELGEDSYAFVHAVFLYNLEEGGDPEKEGEEKFLKNKENWFGILDHKDEPLPAWNVFVTAIEEYDGTPVPNTFITGKTITATTAEFTFGVNDETSSLDCQLDAGAWTPCTSPKKYTGLASGAHTFRVRATNAEATESGPATYSWPPPQATTEPVSGVKTKEATLNGAVNPNGLATTYRFEYGKTTSYGTSVPVPSESIGSGTEALAKSKTISGLLPETTYHYRVVAEGSGGTTYGADRSFTTLAITPTYMSSFGAEGSGPGEFLWPLGLVIDSGDNIWVADYYGRIQKFNAKGEYLSQFGKAGGGNGEFNVPIGMTLTAGGDLLVVDSGNSRVQKFNAKGEYLSQFGKAGSGNGQFKEPWDVAVAPNGNIWVSDSGNNRLQEFTAAGTFVREVHGAGYGGTGNGELSNPRGLTTDAAGNVWVADVGNNRVQQFSSTGQYLSKFGSKGSGDGQFEAPIEVVVKSSGNLFVLDGENHRVQQFSPSGEFLGKFGGSLGWPNFLALGKGGTFFVVAPGYREIQKWRQPTAPEAMTESASGVKAGEATLNGKVNPGAAAATYRFEYGPTTSYGTSVPAPSESIGSGTEALAKSKTISGLSPGTTYHYRIVAENSEGTTYGKDVTFVPTVASSLSAMAVTEPFNGSAESVSNFSTKWSALQWASGSTPKGASSAGGWGPVDAHPTINGAYYGTAVSGSEVGSAAVATLAANPASSSRYFSLWLGMSSPATTRSGYELRFTYGFAGVYTVALYKWQEGVQSTLASKAAYSFANGSSFALVDQGGTVSAWTNTGSGFAQLLSASDSTFEAAKAGIAGAGSATRLTNFKAGPL